MDATERFLLVLGNITPGPENQKSPCRISRSLLPWARCSLVKNRMRSFLPSGGYLADFRWISGGYPADIRRGDFWFSGPDERACVQLGWHILFMLMPLHPLCRLRCKYNFSKVLLPSLIRHRSAEVNFDAQCQAWSDKAWDDLKKKKVNVLMSNTGKEWYRWIFVWNNVNKYSSKQNKTIRTAWVI